MDVPSESDNARYACIKPSLQLLHVQSWECCRQTCAGKRLCRIAACSFRVLTWKARLPAAWPPSFHQSYVRCVILRLRLQSTACKATSDDIMTNTKRQECGVRTQNQKWLVTSLGFVLSLCLCLSTHRQSDSHTSHAGLRCLGAWQHGRLNASSIWRCSCCILVLTLIILVLTSTCPYPSSQERVWISDLDPSQLRHQSHSKKSVVIKLQAGKSCGSCLQLLLT